MYLLAMILVDDFCWRGRRKDEKHIIALPSSRQISWLRIAGFYWPNKLNFTQQFDGMKKYLLIYFTVISFLLINVNQLFAQCSICTKTASQMGEKAGRGFNGGIMYLGFVPFIIGGYIGYRWWKQEKMIQRENSN